VITSFDTLRKIREVIDKHYKKLTLSVLGSSVFTPKELKDLKDSGVDTSNTESLLELIYNHNYLNPPTDPQNPGSLEDMRNQQSVAGVVPRGDAHAYSIQSINENTRQHIEKLKMDVASRIEGIVRQNNDSYKNNALQNLDRSDFADKLVKESTLGRVKQQLRDTSKDANRDWQRVALTEMGNAIGAGSVDKLVVKNRDKDLNEVYTFRIIVGDSKTCKMCRRFYQDSDNAPKVYRLSTLLANGSNYGKKQDQWLPVTGSTHPNSRTSQVIELPPGWKVLPGGSLTYIGMEKWRKYILEKLDS